MRSTQQLTNCRLSAYSKQRKNNHTRELSLLHKILLPFKSFHVFLYKILKSFFVVVCLFPNKQELSRKFPGNLPYKMYSYNWTNQTIRTLCSWNLHTKPLPLLMENCYSWSMQLIRYFFRTHISHSWKPNKPNGDQPRRLSKTALLEINSSCSWWHLTSLIHVYRDNVRPLSFMQWWDQLWAHTDSYCSTNTLRCLEYQSPNPNYPAVIWSW